MPTSCLSQTASATCPKTTLRSCEQHKAERHFTVTGVLLDQEDSGMDFSLKSFLPEYLPNQRTDRRAGRTRPYRQQSILTT